MTVRPLCGSRPPASKEAISEMLSIDSRRGWRQGAGPVENRAMLMYVQRSSSAYVQRVAQFVVNV